MKRGPMVPPPKRKKSNLLKEMFLAKDMLLLIIICICLSVPLVTTIKTVGSSVTDDSPLFSEDSYSSIELINYDSDIISPFDFTKVEVIEELDKTLFTDFLEDYHSIELNDEPDDAFYVGQCIRIVRTNGEFEIIALNHYSDEGYHSFVGRFDEDGSILQLVGGIRRDLMYMVIATHYFGDSYTQPEHVITIP